MIFLLFTTISSDDQNCSTKKSQTSAEKNPSQELVGGSRAFFAYYIVLVNWEP